MIYYGGGGGGASAINRTFRLGSEIYPFVSKGGDAAQVTPNSSSERADGANGENGGGGGSGCGDDAMGGSGGTGFAVVVVY